MFCSQCGKQLIPNAVFCSTCGNRAAAVAPQSFGQQQPQQNTYVPTAPAYQPPGPVNNTVPGGDDTALVLKTTRKLSLTNAVSCQIIFKPNWLVLAHLTTNLQKIENARLQESFKAQNLGMMKRSAAQMRFWGDFHKRYFSMSTSAITAEDPTNQVISYAQITSVLYQCSYTTSTEDSSYENDGKLHITLTNRDVIKLSHREVHDKAVKDLLTGLFGTRLSYKK